MQLPEVFLARMKELLGAEYDDFLASYESPSLRGLRLNLLKSCYWDGFADFTTVPWCSEGFIVPEDIRPSKDILYRAGLFYIQEPSAMCPAQVLAAQPGERVLDICAAPGGKSAQIAGHMRGKGLLVANDASPSRCKALTKNLEMAGVTNAIVLAEQPKKLAERFPEFFDRILVDAPCSGEGMFRRDAEAVKAYTANKPEACMRMQREILHYAAHLLKPGGRLVYSTCTFNPMENEDVIAWFLAGHGDFSLVPIDHEVLGVAPGMAGLTHTARIWPHLASGEGHFVACLQKNGEAHSPANNYRAPKVPKEFAEFCGTYLKDFNLHRPIVKHGVSLYIQPTELDLAGLRVVRSGWYVGDISGGRFSPSQALAMGISPADAAYPVELSQDDAWRYLRGESIPADVALEGKPWVLICHLGFPLGWARLVQGRLKNSLPVGWVVK